MLGSDTSSDDDLSLSFKAILDEVRDGLAKDYAQVRIDLAVARAENAALRERLSDARAASGDKDGEAEGLRAMVTERDALITDLRAQVDVLIERVRAQDPTIAEDAQQVDGARVIDHEERPAAA